MRILTLTLLSLLVSTVVLAGDFVDTQITFTYGDDNIFETSKRSVIANFGERDDEMFNENLNTYKTGDETETMLVVYKKFEGFIPLLTVESAFVMNLKVYSNDTGRVGSKVIEDGSYIRLSYGRDSNKFRLTAFPYDSDRFLLGWTYDLSWGGQSFWPKSKINKSTPVPGLKLEWLRNDEINVFLGFKTRNTNVVVKEEDDLGNLITNDTIASTWAVMGGGYYDFRKMLRLDVHAGMFYKGTNQLTGSDIASEDNIYGDKIYANGVSARLSFRKNFDMAVSREMKVYRNDKREDLKVGKKEVKQAHNFGYMISAEGVFLTENLKDADYKNAIDNFNAWAFDLKFKMYFNKMKLNSDIIMRNVEFLLFNVPGLSPYETISESATVTNEIMFSLGGEVEVMDHLTLGLLFGVKKPASYETKSNVKVVIKDREDNSAFTGGLRKNKVKMPLGESVKPIYAIKTAAIYELAKGVKFTTEIFFVRDRNDTTLSKDNRRVIRDSKETNRLGFSLILQSTF